MAMSTPSTAAARPISTFDLGENQKRWVVVGIGLHRVLLPVLCDFVGQELPKHYTSLKSAHGVDTQVYKGPHLTHDGPFKLNYGSINNNLATFKRKESCYDYKVNTAEDLAKLYLEPHMAKFTGFDNSCDLSAVLGILANASIFPSNIQTIAKDVRSKVRNEWGHCNFDHWTDNEIGNCFDVMERLLGSLGLPNADEAKVVGDLCDWKEKDEFKDGRIHNREVFLRYIKARERIYQLRNTKTFTYKTSSKWCETPTVPYVKDGLQFLQF